MLGFHRVVAGLTRRCIEEMVKQERDSGNLSTFNISGYQIIAEPSSSEFLSQVLTLVEKAREEGICGRPEDGIHTIFQSPTSLNHDYTSGYRCDPEIYKWNHSGLEDVKRYSSYFLYAILLAEEYRSGNHKIVFRGLKEKKRLLQEKASSFIERA